VAYECRVEADSINGVGDRLTTFVVTYPRFVHSELLTHRMLSRNSSSSRAIPITKMIEQVQTDPVLPIWWGRNQGGMQAREELTHDEVCLARTTWLAARDEAVVSAKYLTAIGLHKQIVNRILEPWMWITVIVSATTWENFFALRCHPDAQPEIRKIADMMRAAMEESKPVLRVGGGVWHLPFIKMHEHQHNPIEDIVKISAARCARVSYLTHDGKYDKVADITLCDRLAASGHWSPFEHVAQAMPSSMCHSIDGKSGNFTGWLQFRQIMIEGRR